MKVLLLQLKRIGDLILTTPVVRSLREAHPGAHITLLVDASAAQIVDGIPVDERLVFDRRASLVLGLLGAGGNAWAARLRSAGYDYVLDFTGTDRSALLTRFSGAKRRVTYARFAKKFLRRFVYTDFVEASVRDLHTADYHARLLGPVGGATASVPLSLDPPNASALLAAAGLTGRYAVIHAGTARPEKYWLADRWAAVARHLSAQGLQVVLTGSSAPEEQEHLHAIKIALADSPAVAPVDLSGRTGLLELAAVIRGAAIFCGVDTAAMHLADAMRTPTIALFGPTNPFHWRTRHTLNATLCARTEEPFTPAQKGGPMGDLATATVTDAVDRILAAARAASFR